MGKLSKIMIAIRGTKRLRLNAILKPIGII